MYKHIKSKSYRLIALSLFAVMLVSCKKGYSTSTVDGIEVISNHSASDADLQIEINRLYRYSNPQISNISAWDVGADGSLYLQDSKQSKIFKYNRSTDSTISFGNRGFGPGEFVLNSSIGSLFWFKHKIYTVVPENNKAVVFSESGLHLGDIQISGLSYPVCITTINNTSVIGCSMLPEIGEKDIGLKLTVGFFDSLFNQNTVIHSDKMVINADSPADPSVMFSKYCVKDNLIYVAINSEDFYNILCYDLDGKLLKKITKSYKKMAFTDADYKKNSLLIKAGKENLTINYKKSIDAVFIDSQSRLWVATAKSETDKHQGLKFDIFKDGIYLNSVYLKLSVCDENVLLFNDVKIRGDLLYTINRDSLFVDVYKIIK